MKIKVDKEEYERWKVLIKKINARLDMSANGGQK